MANALKQGGAPEKALRGLQVAFTGKLVSLTRQEAARLVRTHGGRFAPSVTRDTGLLVIGQEGWPLQTDGRLSNKLRRARLLQRRGHGLAILTEEAFLHRLGLEEDSEDVRARYSLPQLARLLRVSRDRLRTWMRAGLIRPIESREGVDYFDFRQVAGAKTLCELTQAGATPDRIRRSFRQMAHWLGDPGEGDDFQEPLAQLAVIEETGRLFVRLDDGRLAETTGQLQFDFTPTSQHNESPSVPLLAGKQCESAEDLFEQGCDHESAGRLEEALQSYRRALLAGGPDADLCFNLANALYALNRREQAVERYRQAVEMDRDFAEAWNNLGTVLAETKQLDEALAAFRRALELEPFYSDAHYNLADLLEELGRPREARPHWQAYLKADVQSPWAAHARRRLQG